MVSIPRWFKLSWCVGLFSVSTACFCAPNEAVPVTLVPAGEAPGFPREYFGIHVHWDGEAPMWPSIPFGSIRLWDARVVWPNLQPQENTWEWRRLDAYVAWAVATNTEVVLPLGLSPRWASSRPNEPCPYGPGLAAEPANLENWRTYVRAVATRYRGRIKAYEIWNEANLKLFFTGNTQALVALTVAAQEEIRRVDDRALIVAPSAVGLDSRVAWPAQFLSALPTKVDVANFHLYHLDQPPEAMIGPVMELKASLAKAALSGMPLWNSETGYLVPNEHVRWEPEELRQQISNTVAATQIPRAMLISRALGFERFFWYAWNNKKMGLIDTATGRLRPQALVLSQFMELLSGSQLKQCNRGATAVWRCDLVLADSRKAIAIWMDPTAGGAASLESPFKTGVMYRLDGTSRGVESPKQLRVDSTVSVIVEL